jgi:hypothetical protein
MGTKARGFLLTAGILGSILIGAAPALAQSHGGGHSGGGHSSGGHSGGGGGHAAAGGHYGGGAHYAGAGHFGGGAAYGRGYSGGFRGSYGGYHGTYGGYGHSGGYGGHGYYGHGYSTGSYWRGGYWHGGFWPRAYYGVGFSWFLPVLPLAYATYWYGGLPYYYANDVYYTYNPDYEGYVATDPPPVADSGAGAEGAAPSAGPPPSEGAAAGAGQIFMYPKNGQSPEQQATDKAQCQQWAAQQAGQVAQNGSDYQRAMVACVEGRGYSAR